MRDLTEATYITRFVFMVNHADGSGFLLSALGRRRVVLAFPGAAGGIEDGIDHYVEVAEQPTVLEALAPDIAATLRAADFKVSLVPDMDAWLRRHAVFVTAITGALYMKTGNARLLAPRIPQPFGFSFWVYARAGTHSTNTAWRRSLWLYTPSSVAFRSHSLRSTAAGCSAQRAENIISRATRVTLPGRWPRSQMIFVHWLLTNRYLAYGACTRPST